MQGSTDGLWIAASAAAVAALALSMLGRQQPPQRGHALWRAALWLSTAGTALTAVVGTHSVLAPWLQVLVLAWPLLTLAGMRQFHARIDWPGNERLDRAVLGASALLLGSSGLWPADSALGSVAAPAGLLVAYLYAAGLMVTTGTRRDARPMHLLGGVVALGACAPLVLALPGLDLPVLFETHAICASLAQLAMAFIVGTLVSDRHEQHLRASRRRLRALASIDPLTQVPNRRHFEELAVQALKQDPPASAVLMMFDVDHFKRINDQLGHAGGDRALRLVARCVRELLRVQDVPCRHGGDEFVLLLRHASVHDAMRVAARLVDRLQGRSLDAALPTVSLSFGVVQVRPAETLPEALKRADQALYEAKRQGRSRAVAAGGSEAMPRFTESRPLGLTSA